MGGCDISKATRSRSGAGTWTILGVLLRLFALAVYILVAGWSKAGDASTDINVAGYVSTAIAGSDLRHLFS